MSRAEVFVAGILAHYASEYYDPVKAREYYLRTRELKGRNSGANLKTTAKKQAWAYAKNKIGEAKKAELKSSSEKNKAFIESARKQASEKRKELSKKLVDILGDKGLSGESKKWHEEHSAKRTAALEKVSKLAKTESDRISKEAADKTEKLREDIKKVSEDAKRQIEALPEIPKGLSKERHAELAARRSEDIAKIQGTAKQARTSLGEQAVKIRSESSAAKKAVSTWASNERKSISENSSAELKTFNDKASSTAKSQRTAAAKSREEVGKQLKSTVEKARADYETLKQGLVAKYDRASNVEYEAIRRKV